MYISYIECAWGAHNLSEMQETKGQALSVVRGAEEHKRGQYPHHQTHSIQDGCVLEAQGEVHLVMASIAGVISSISLNTCTYITCRYSGKYYVSTYYGWETGEIIKWEK